jgi:hypothetical protein
MCCAILFREWQEENKSVFIQYRHIFKNYFPSAVDWIYRCRTQGYRMSLYMNGKCYEKGQEDEEGSEGRE